MQPLVPSPDLTESKQFDMVNRLADGLMCFCMFLNIHYLTRVMGEIRSAYDC